MRTFHPRPFLLSSLLSLFVGAACDDHAAPAQPQAGPRTRGYDAGSPTDGSSVVPFTLEAAGTSGAAAKPAICGSFRPLPGSGCRDVDVGVVCPSEDLSFGIRCERDARGVHWVEVRGAGSPACPDKLPAPASPCPAGQHCQYPQSLDRCSQELLADAVCSAESQVWELWYPATCAASSTHCDPTGSWIITLEPDDEDAGPSHFCSAPLGSLGFEVRSVDQGFQLKGLEGKVTADGCRLELSRTIAVSNTSEYWSDTYEIALDLGSSEPTGTFTRVARGFCNGRAQGHARAQRAP